MKSILAFTFLLLQTTLVMAADNPIKIILDGTNIHTLPGEVIIVSENPEERVKEFAKKMNFDYSHFGFIWDHVNEVTYYFVEPTQLNIHGIMRQGKDGPKRFNEADVIYMFYFKSKETSDLFRERYNIRDTDLVDGFQNLYSTTKGYFVRILTNVGKPFTCPMHLQIRVKKAGRCPICEMELTKMGDHVEKLFTCPMDPQIKENKAGRCPVCGMKLIKKYNYR